MTRPRAELSEPKMAPRQTARGAAEGKPKDKKTENVDRGPSTDDGRLLDAGGEDAICGGTPQSVNLFIWR